MRLHEAQKNTIVIKCRRENLFTKRIHIFREIHQGLEIFKQTVICLRHTVCVRGIEIYDLD